MQGLSQPFKIKTFEVGPMQNLIYVIWDIETKLTALIDPAWDLTNVNSFIKKNGLTLDKILLTHSHHDHVNSIDGILTDHDVQIHINKKEKSLALKCAMSNKINTDNLIFIDSLEIKSHKTKDLKLLTRIEAKDPYCPIIYIYPSYL